ncbi:MAG: hypothetical protein R2792_05095 [Saprospiraceae bacterium]|jgi:hypothetical protein
MNIFEQLNKIWSKDYINDMPGFVKERGFVCSKNDSKMDLLITGINPSFREGENPESFCFDFHETMKETKYDNYWGPLRKILVDAENEIDLRSRTAYLDIFYFREKMQGQIRNGILKRPKGIEFLMDQLIVTQKLIEEIIKPKVIIVKNKESAAYWGKLSDKGIIWMGYKIVHEETLNCGELYKIAGLIDSPDRIARDIKITNLKNSFILFSVHINQYTKREKRPTAVIVNDLLNRFNIKS